MSKAGLNNDFVDLQNKMHEWLRITFGEYKWEGDYVYNAKGKVIGTCCFFSEYDNGWVMGFKFIEE